MTTLDSKTRDLPIFKHFNETEISSAFFYIGVLNQKSGKYEEAIEKYQTIIDNNNTLLVEQSKWYKGLCYLKMHKNKKALEQFKELSKHSTYYKDYADEIIKKLK